MKKTPKKFNLDRTLTYLSLVASALSLTASYWLMTKVQDLENVVVQIIRFLMTGGQ